MLHQDLIQLLLVEVVQEYLLVELLTQVIIPLFHQSLQQEVEEVEIMIVVVPQEQNQEDLGVVLEVVVQQVMLVEQVILLP